MKKVILSQSNTENALSLLDSKQKFEVLAKTIFNEKGMADFVLGRFGWSWGHFYQAAFCNLSPNGENEVILKISHLNVQRQWHGRNIFRYIDSKIEEEIAGYILANIPSAKIVDAD